LLQRLDDIICDARLRPTIASTKEQAVRFLRQNTFTNCIHNV
jgi:hypothetical protein